MIEASALIAEARSRTGLQNFGNDSFREPLDRLLASVNRESRFSEFGAVAFRAMLVQPLVNRLEVEEWYRRHPEIDAEEIIAPSFIVGLPRTGSTLLSNLLALDPATRSLRVWESSAPSPPPLFGDASDFRIAEAETRMRGFLARYPQLSTMIPAMGVHAPTECHELMFMSFDTDYYYQYAECPSFIEWFHDPRRDYSHGYRYHKRVLKLLQWRCPPKRWVLKMPGHCLMIEGLHKVYPDARFVMTHRNPIKVLSSVARLVEIFRKDFLEDPRTALFSKMQARVWETSLRRLMSFRERNEQRFFDVYHSNLLSHPLLEVERLYPWLGWTKTATLFETVAEWVNAHPTSENPSDPLAPNFDTPDVYRQFAFYTKRFFSIL